MLDAAKWEREGQRIRNIIALEEFWRHMRLTNDCIGEIDKTPQYLVKLVDYLMKSGFNFDFADMLSGSPTCYGMVKWTDRIVQLKTNLPDNILLSTLIHEVTHTVLHWDRHSDQAWNPWLQEVEAEMTVLRVMHRLGMPSTYSMWAESYILLWMEDRPNILEDAAQDSEIAADLIVELLNG